MERFMLFAGCAYYPEGGMKDFKGSSESFGDLKDTVRSGGWDWWHIYDNEHSNICDQGLYGVIGEGEIR